tara:strand:+ start:1775 stop:2401 length:627 start_codon:yes stop_codon:yes gene_type:complete
MSEETLNKRGFIDFLKSKKKLLFVLIGIGILLLLSFIWFEYNKQNKKTIISENFIKAKVLYSQGKKNESLEIFKEIIQEKDDIYSALSLFLIIDKNLEINDKKIINYFDTVISIRSLTNEDLNLIKLKKAIFISEDSNEQNIINLLNPIINSESVWKMESLKFLGDYFFSSNQLKKAEQYYSLFLKESPDGNVDTREIRRKMKLIRNE